MTNLPYLDQIQADTFALLETLRRAPDRSVPSCPGWDVVRLAGHVGRVHRMAAMIVQDRLVQPPARDAIEAPPEDAGTTEGYLLRGLARMLETLRGTPVDSPAWNMTGEATVAAFWSRRIAHETAVHRADAEMAAELPITPLPTPLAIDGVDEFFSLYPSRVLIKAPQADLGGSLHLHATDGHGEWMIYLRNGTLTVEHGHGKGDAAVRGTASDLLYGVWGRLPLTGDRFQRFGDEAVVAALETLGAF